MPASLDPARAAVEIAAFVDGLLVHTIGGDDSPESIEANCDDAVTRLLGLDGPPARRLRSGGSSAGRGTFGPAVPWRGTPHTES